MTEDQKLANELSQKATKLRDSARQEWKTANEHLAVMGKALDEVHQINVELAVLLKKMSK